MGFRAASWARNVVVGASAAALAVMGTAPVSATAAPQAASSAAAAAPAAEFHLDRVAGNNRYATAAAIATSAFPHGAPDVIIANGAAAHFPDALTAGYLAGTKTEGEPILLVGSAAVPTETDNALATLGAKHLTVIGGVGAVGASVVAHLQHEGMSVRRLSGPDRFTTMKAVDEAAPTTIGTVGGKKTAIIADGDNFPDALAAGAIAFAEHFPMILVESHRLPAAAGETLHDLGIGNIVIVGGTAAVGADVEHELNQLGFATLERAAGTSRSDTARQLADYAIDHLGFAAAHLDIASGAATLGGVDALAGAVPAGLAKSVTLITDNVTAPGAVTTFIAEHCSALSDGHVFGGPGAISDAAMAVITSAAQTCANASPTVTLDQGGTVVAGHALKATVTAPAGRTITGVSLSGACLPHSPVAVAVPYPTKSTVQVFVETSDGAQGDCPVQFTITYADDTTGSATETLHVQAISPGGGGGGGGGSTVGSISGTVTDESGHPLHGVDVLVIDDADDVGPDATTAGDGTYTISGVTPGTHTVCFMGETAAGGSSSGGYLDECWENSAWDPYWSWPTGTTPVTVDAGAVTSDVNARLAEGGAITGKVTDGAGNPLNDISVELTSSSGALVGAVATDSDGGYNVGGLVTGNYHVCFFAGIATGGRSSVGYLDECHGGGAPIGYPPVGGTDVSVTTGRATSGLADALPDAGGITGTVRDSAGNAVVGVDVEVWRADHTYATSVRTGTDGSYAVPRMQAGDFQVCFGAENASGSDSGYLDQCYKGVG